MRLVVKVGTSSLTDEEGRVDSEAVGRLAVEVAKVRAMDHQVVLVSSGAIAAGLPALGWSAGQRPRDPRTLQAVSAVGQAHLLGEWNRAFEGHGLVSGQVLLAPLDFGHRAQYLQARSTLERLLEMGVVPVVNENDAIADDEIRFGDNDRIAALVAQLVGAELLVLLTAGLMDADPRLTSDAALVEEVAEIDRELERVSAGAGTARGSGGMSSKLSAAKMASWSGVRCLIANAARADVLADAINGERGVGTWVPAHERRLGARKLWIAFAMPSAGRLVIDDGAVRALTVSGRSLLPAGVVEVQGDFSADDAVEVLDSTGTVVAKGLVRAGSDEAARAAGRRSDEVDLDELIHRDDLVVLS